MDLISDHFIRKQKQNTELQVIHNGESEFQNRIDFLETWLT